MNILITGATGLIGWNVKKYLENNLSKIDVIIGTSRQIDSSCELFQCDLSKEYDVEKLFNTYNFDIIIHCAANALTDIKKTGIESIWKNNISSTKYLLEYANPKSKFIFCSSSTVYHNDSLSRGASENDIPNPLSFYGWSKWVCEKLIQEYCREKNITGVIARLCATVGQNSKHGVVHDLYRKFKNSNEVEVIGKEPGTLKPFIHIDDVVKFFKIAVDKDFSYAYNVYNICNTDGIWISDICNILQEKIGKRQLKWTGSTWVGDNSVVKIQNEKAKNELDFYPLLNNFDAISKTIDDYIRFGV